MNKTIRQPLLISIMFFLFSLIFVLIFTISFNDYKTSNISYEDLTYKEFTVEHIRETTDPEMGNTYYISVVEENKQINVNNLLTNKEVINGILSLNAGDKIYCYLIEDSSYYEVAELKTSTATIFSLDEYKEIYNHQGVLGLIISPIGFTSMLGFSIWGFVLYMKEKKCIN